MPPCLLYSIFQWILEYLWSILYPRDFPPCAPLSLFPLPESPTFAVYKFKVSSETSPPWSTYSLTLHTHLLPPCKVPASSCSFSDFFSPQDCCSCHSQHGIVPGWRGWQIKTPDVLCQTPDTRVRLKWKWGLSQPAQITSFLSV